jgi:thioredoxin-related protein/Tfp pilus assembly protein PilF
MFKVRFSAAALAAVLVCMSTLAGLACAAESLWTTNFEEAKAKAKADKKLLLVDFTGSDWCGWCIKLKDEVFDKEVFKAEAPKRFVLVELDFPRQKKLPDELKKQNDELAKQFKVRGFPTILMLDAEGQPIAKTGYRPGGPEKYVAHLGDFIKAHEFIVQMRGQVDKVKGLERAKLLDQLIDAYVKLDNEIDDLKTWSQEIIALDADNKAGLKVKHEFRLLIAEANSLKAARKFDEAKVTFDKALVLSGISGEQKQDAYFAQGECLFYLKDFASLVTCLKKAVDAAPDSPKVSNLQAMIQRFAPMAEAQEAVAKIKTQLATAQGLERARLLDQMIDAQAKLAQVGGGDQTQDVEKLSQEIIKLDADNKAGLKQKHELRVLLAEATKELRAKNFDAAHAALDKALAVPGLAGESLQEARQTKANCYFAQQEFEKAKDCLQKALEAAPTSQRAPMLKAMIQRAEQQIERQKAKEQPKPEAPNKSEPKKTEAK